MHSYIAQTRPRLEPLEDRVMLSTCHVTRLTDQGIGKGFRGDLRYCINKVNAEPGPDVIDFNVTGTINLIAPLSVITDDLVLQGPGPALLSVRRNSGGFYRIFTIPNGVSAEISGLTITNGDAGFNDGGGGLFNAGSLTLSDGVISGNKAQYGAGIANSGLLTMSDCRVTGNVASTRGGGIDNVYGTVTVDNCVVSGNGLSSGDGNGGGLANNWKMNLSAVTVSDNSAQNGGGIRNNVDGVLTIQASTFSENKSGGFGGAIDNIGSAMISDSSFSLNRAYWRGGAISNQGNATMVISASTLSGNWCSSSIPSTAMGGGIYNQSGTVTIENSTLFGNSVPNDPNSGGGAIQNLLDGIVNLTLSTIAGNWANGHAGGIRTEDATVNIRNSIVAGNSAAMKPNVNGTVFSLGHNLFGVSNGGLGYAASDLLDVDPILGPLADNGGPTLTLALLPGSPAIDVGDNTDAPVWDQRGPGFPRIVNGTIDIGAFEVQATGATGTTIDFAVLITADFGDSRFNARGSH